MCVLVCVVWGVTHIWGIDVGLIFRTHKPLPQNNTMHADLTQSIDGSLALVSGSQSIRNIDTNTAQYIIKLIVTMY